MNEKAQCMKDEFMKILGTGSTSYLLQTGILYKIIPEFKGMLIDGGSKHDETVESHSIICFVHIASISDNPLLNFTALCHDMGKMYTQNEIPLFEGHDLIGAEKVKEIMLRMEFSTDEIDFVYTMIKNHMHWHFYNGTPTKKAIRKAIRKIGEHNISSMLKLVWADTYSNLKNEMFVPFDVWLIQTQWNAKIKEALDTKLPKKLSELAINGDDLIALGYKPSPLFSTILNNVFDKVDDEKIANTRNSILKYIKEHYK